VENCKNTSEIYYKDIDEYKSTVNDVIVHMIAKKERLVFAVVCERSGINPFIIRRYPELRNYVLQRMVYYKEIHVINQKIDRAVSNLLKASSNITFMAIVNKCKFSSDIIYNNQYIKDRIRNVIAANYGTKNL
jgi:hypothetical protein